MVSPHAWVSCTLTELNVRPPDTGTGVALLAAALPREPVPQQYAACAVVTPHAYANAALSVANVSPPPTATGNGCGVTSLDPMPSCPSAFRPQQYAAPLVVTPHVVVPPALSDVNVRPPATGTGALDAVVLPVPSSPSAFTPQHHAAPFVAIPQLCDWPAALTAANVMPPETATGAGWGSALPLPSWPPVLSPQQYATPAMMTPQLWFVPTLTDANTRLPETTPVFPCAASPTHCTAPFDWTPHV